jgi:hypothetical protein
MTILFRKYKTSATMTRGAMIGAKRANIASLNTFRPIDLSFILKAGTGLTAAGRKRLSDLIKKRWAERRKKAAAKIK